MPDNKEWEALRKEARSVENLIDSKLLLLSRYGSSDIQDNEPVENGDDVPLLSDSAGGVFDRISRETESLLARLTEINSRMSQFSDQNQSSSYTVQRHRDILNDYTKEFKKTKTNVTCQREREQLFQTTRGGIPETKVNIPNQNKAADILMREHNSTLNSEQMVNEQIEVALRTRETMMNQRTALKAIHSQMTTLANRFPMINSLISRINLKRRKDTVILASVIGFCLFLIILYKL